MLLESLDTELPIQLLLGLGLGLIFGIAAQISRFCLRRAVAGEGGADKGALSVWLLALGVAIAAVQGAQAFGFVALEDHRHLSAELPIAAIVLGGALFGLGMVLTRGCASRLTVLAASGNLRAVSVLVIFAIAAHATLKGVLAPLRTQLGAATVELPFGTFAELPLISILAPAALLIGAIWLAIRSRASLLHLGLAAVIGLTVALGWASTSVLFFDEFEPAPVQSLAFTSTWSDSLFWTVASTAIPAGFGVGLIGGVIAGTFLSAAARGELELQSFSSPGETLRYGAGGLLMGVGGVLAGGCTIGAGLSGVSTLSVAALLALLSIVGGAMLARQVLDSKPSGALA